MMNVKELIVKLLDMPLDADVFLDTDDLVTSQNYQKVTYVRSLDNGYDDKVVVLDADWGKK